MKLAPFVQEINNLYSWKEEYNSFYMDVHNFRSIQPSLTQTIHNYTQNVTPFSFLCRRYKSTSPYSVVRYPGVFFFSQKTLMMKLQENSGTLSYLKLVPNVTFLQQFYH